MKPKLNWKILAKAIVAVTLFASHGKLVTAAEPEEFDPSLIVRVSGYRNCTIWCGSVRDSRTGERVSPDRAESFMHDSRMGNNYIYRGDGSVTRKPGDRRYQENFERELGRQRRRDNGGGYYWNNSYDPSQLNESLVAPKGTIRQPAQAGSEESVLQMGI